MLNCAVIVVTHNSDATWPDVCKSIAALVPAPVELCVVDNRSDTAPPLPAELASTVQRILNQGNRGFAVASNQGAAATAAEWLLFLNPDCFLRQGDLQALLQAANQLAELGILGAQWVNADGSLQQASCRDDPTPRRLLSGLTSLASRRSRPLRPGLAAVDAVSGALMLMPRRVFEQVGGFDPSYRLHCEDLDLCRRVRQAGYTVAIASEIKVTHLKGTSSRRRPIWVEWQKHVGMWRYYRKFDRAGAPFGLSGLVLLGLCLRFPLSALRAWWQARRG